MASHILHRQNNTPMIPVASGEGVYLVDAQGKRYLDGSGGAAVSCLGHGHARINQAIKDQLDQLAFAHTGFFTNHAAEALADHLCARAPGDFGRVIFVAGGSEAMEAALKLTRQIHVERGEAKRMHFIARRQSYHGCTLGALSVGYHAQRRKIYAPMLSRSFSHIAPAYAYRHQHIDESNEAYGKRAAQELEHEILKQGAETVAGFVAETVVGATLGVVPPPAGYFREIRRICDKYGVLLILDEVMCGSGRTGSLFACEQEGVKPDLVAIAKGLGAGYQPIGALLVSTKNAKAIIEGSGILQHGHTYMAHATACAAALAVQQVIEEENLLSKVQTRGIQLMNVLQQTFGQHAHVGDIRGRGLFIGLELVANRETKAAFARDRNVAARIKAAAFQNGLICYPDSGTVDGIHGDHILLAPAFIISESEIEALVELLEKSMQEVMGT